MTIKEKLKKGAGWARQKADEAKRKFDEAGGVEMVKGRIANAASAAVEKSKELGRRMTESPAARLRQLKELHDAGVITDEEFEQKRHRYVDRL
jgi:hypothetical protein